MENKKNPPKPDFSGSKKPGRGNVEFLANIEVIKELSDKGYTIASIYDYLKKQGKLTIKRPQFYIYFKRSGIKIKTVQELNELYTSETTSKKEKESGKLIIENDPSKQDRHF